MPEIFPRTKGHSRHRARRGARATKSRKALSVSDVEMIRMQDINAAYERLLKNDVRYRFVIDIASLREAA